MFLNKIIWILKHSITHILIIYVCVVDLYNVQKNTCLLNCYKSYYGQLTHAIKYRRSVIPYAVLLLRKTYKLFTFDFLLDFLF